MIYNYISTHFYATCLVLYAWYRVNLEILIFWYILPCFYSIELVGKTPKMDDKWEVCKQWLMEALACMCEHLGVIKFLAIHIKTIKAYTLWWNGGTFQEILDYNMKYSPIMDNCILLWQLKLSVYKRWHHHCIGLQRSEMPPTQRKCIGGLPENGFLSVVNREP